MACGNFKEIIQWCAYYTCQIHVNTLGQNKLSDDTSNYCLRFVTIKILTNNIYLTVATLPEYTRFLVLMLTMSILYFIDVYSIHIVGIWFPK